MTNTMTPATLPHDVVDAYGHDIQLGDGAVDLNSGCKCAVLDFCPELGPESLYVKLVEHDGPDMTCWVEPAQLVRLPRQEA